MPGRAEHVAQARTNRALAQHLVQIVAVQAPDPVPEGARQWAATVAFYAAVHAVEAHFASVGAHHRVHSAREQAIARDASLSPVVADYGLLKTQSVLARYECWSFSDGDLRGTTLPALDRLLAHVRI